MISPIWRIWTYRLGLAGACLISVGCGGSDVPDPSSDTTATVASDAPAPAPVAAEPKAEEPAAPAPAAELPAPEVAAAAPAPAPSDAPAPAAAPPPTPATGDAPATPKAADAPDQVAGASGADAASPAPAAPEGQPKPDTGSATAEMLALSSGSSPAVPPPAAGAAPGGPAAASPPANAAPRGRNAKLDDDGPAAGAVAKNNARRDDLGTFGGGGRNREGGIGRPARDSSKPVNFSNPRESVQAFLDALEDKDVDRLSEATALRSPLEASAKNRDLFQKIVNGSISEAQLNDLAEKLDEYTILGEAQVKSTGRLGILISKTTETGRHQRTVIVRKEKAGWKVLDFIDFIDFKMNAPRNRARTSR